MARVGGIIQLQIDGEIYNAKGAFDYNLGRPKRDAVVGHDRVHGYKSLPQVPYIEGKVTDRGTMDLDKLVTSKGVTVTLELANGKVIVLRDAFYASEGKGNSEEGEIECRFEGMSAEEVA
jgi:hypothetical protein